jgi:type III secretory pathway lipoprotein EscJ
MMKSPPEEIKELVQGIVDIVAEINPLMQRHEHLLAQLEGIVAAGISVSLGTKIDTQNPDCEGQAVMVIAQHRVASYINNEMVKRGMLVPIKLHFGGDPRRN